MQAAIRLLEKLVSCFFVHRAEILYLLPVDLRLDALLKIGAMLARDEPGNLQRHSGFFCHLNGAMRALVTRYASEEQKIIIGSVTELKGADVDPVVHGGNVIQAFRPIGVADGHVVVIPVLSVHGQNPL